MCSCRSQQGNLPSAGSCCSVRRATKQHQPQTDRQRNAWPKLRTTNWSFSSSNPSSSTPSNPSSSSSSSSPYPSSISNSNNSSSPSNPSSTAATPAAQQRAPATQAACPSNPSSVPQHALATPAAAAPARASAYPPRAGKSTGVRTTAEMTAVSRDDSGDDEQRQRRRDAGSGAARHGEYRGTAAKRGRVTADHGDKPRAALIKRTVCKTRPA